MKPLLIVVEGKTEKVFIDNCLKPYLFDLYGLYDVSARVLGVPGKKGGSVAFSRVKNDVTNLLKERVNIVTTFLDYYGMQTDFPDHTHCQQLPFVNDRIACLEQAMQQAINSHRFIPYLQKYEFEALLFSRGNALDKYLKPATCEAIIAVRQAVDGPEEINTGNPPSYRLQELFQQHEGVGYRKTSAGPILALELGMNTLLADCPRFARWVQIIAEKAQSDT